jgi:hypothetical protein
MLKAFLTRIYDTTSRNPLSACNKALILITIAIGATSSHDDWRAILSSEAKKEADKLLQDVNLMIVQVELLMISSHFLFWLSMD